MDILEQMKASSHVVIYAGIFLKQWSVPAGDVSLEQHTHSWPHLTLVMSGSVRVTRGDGDMRTYVAGDVIRVPAGQSHGFVTMSGDVRLACIHAINRADPDKLED